MRLILGSPAPLFPSTGFFRCEGEAMTWREGNLAHWNLYFTLSGEGEARLPAGALRVGPGDLLLLPPRLQRSYRVVEPARGWEFYWMHFNPTAALRRQVRWFDRRQPLILAVADPGLRIRLAAMLEELNEVNLHRADLPERPRLMELLTEAVLVRVAGEQRRPRAGRAIDPRIATAIDRVHRRIGAAHPLGELARAAGLSRSQFHLLFRAGMGRSPQAYLEERRLELARFYLLTTGLSIAEIASSVGYGDPFYFTNRFRKRFGVSPRGFRREGTTRART
jgi:AraC family transcriptional regulator of arabinose operon